MKLDALDHLNHLLSGTVVMYVFVSGNFALANACSVGEWERFHTLTPLIFLLIFFHTFYILWLKLLAPKRAYLSPILLCLLGYAPAFTPVVVYMQYDPTMAHFFHTQEIQLTPWIWQKAIPYGGHCTKLALLVLTITSIRQIKSNIARGKTRVQRSRSHA